MKDYLIEKNGKFYSELLKKIADDRIANGPGLGKLTERIDNLRHTLSGTKDTFAEYEKWDVGTYDSVITSFYETIEVFSAFDEEYKNLKDTNPDFAEEYNILKKMVIEDSEKIFAQYYGDDYEPEEDEENYKMYKAFADSYNTLSNDGALLDKLNDYMTKLENANKGVYGGSKEFNNLISEVKNAVNNLTYNDIEDSADIDEILLGIKKKAGEYLDKKYSVADQASEVELQGRMKLAISIYNYTDRVLSKSAGYIGDVYKPVDSIDTNGWYEDFEEFLRENGIDTKLDADLARVGIMPDSTVNYANAILEDTNFSAELKAVGNSQAKINQLFRAYQEGRLFLEGEENKLIVSGKNMQFIFLDKQLKEEEEGKAKLYEEIREEGIFLKHRLHKYGMNLDRLNKLKEGVKEEPQAAVNLDAYTKRFEDLTNVRGSSDAYRAVEEQLKDYLAVEGKLNAAQRNMLLKNTKQLIKNYMDGKTAKDLTHEYTRKRYTAMFELNKDIDRLIKENASVKNEKAIQNWTASDRRVIISQAKRMLKNCGFSLDNFAMLKAASIEQKDNIYSAERLGKMMSAFKKMPTAAVLSEALEGNKLSLREMDKCYISSIDTIMKIENAKLENRNLENAEINKTGIDEFDRKIMGFVQKNRDNNLEADKIQPDQRVVEEIRL